jgi:hypothetical protein
LFPAELRRTPEIAARITLPVHPTKENLSSPAKITPNAPALRLAELCKRLQHVQIKRLFISYLHITVPVPPVWHAHCTT